MKSGAFSLRLLTALAIASLGLALATAGWCAGAPLSQWVYPSPAGNLLYKFDERGQRIADFSNVGYRSGTAPLPDVTKLIESNRWVFVSPASGDDTTTIQAAINQVAAQSLNANGFRGVVFLNAGEYQLSNTFTISASGVVLKGVSDSSTSGSRLRATSARQYTLLNVDGSGSRTTVSGTTHNLTQKLVPAGTRTFAVDSTSGLAVGHLVRIKRPSTANWIAAIDMDQLGPASGGDPDDVPWTAGSKDLYFDRVITRIEGKWITVDAPLPQTFESQYGGGQIYRYTWSRAENIGIEDLYGVSDYDGSTDEEHGWTFISIRDAQHCWVRNITSQYFGYSTVTVNSGAKWITVADSQNLDPISVIDGGRRYSFNNNGAELALFANNYSRKGRHDFVFGALVPGPNVFAHGTADTAYSDSGPHHRWSVGGLFDLITVNGNEINVQNRGNLGTGHGWAGAYMAVWNSTANSFRVRNPPTARNWLIGSVGTVYSSSCCAVGADPAGTYDRSGTSGELVHPRSLYYAQLQQRMKWPLSEFREYWLGDIDQFSSTNATGEAVNVNANWLAQVEVASALPADNHFDYLAENRYTAFTFDFGLATNEQVRAASLTLSLRAIVSAANDFLYLDNFGAPISYTSLGWNIATSGSSVQTIEVDPALLADGRLNVAVGDDTAVDFAALHLQVAPGVPFLTNSLTPVADAYVRGGAYASDNYGSDTTLQTKDVSASDVNRESFLRWDLSGVTGSPVLAKVRLFCTGTSQAGNENVAAFVSSDSWGESTITFNNKPASGKLFAQWLPVTGQAVEFVVTPFVTDALLNDKMLSLRVSAADDFGGLGNVAYASSEDATSTHRPQLLLLFSNTPPVISNLTNYNGTANTALGPVPFTIGDAQTPASNLVLSASSANTNLVPNANIAFGGSGSNRTVTITPAPNQTGSAYLTLTVSDGGLTASDTFIVNIGSPNTPPIISNVTNRTTPEDTPLVVSFVVNDAETPASLLVVTASSSNTNLVPNSGLALGGSSSNRTLTITPLPDATGTTTVTLTVSDGFFSTNDTFVLTVTPVNDPPEFVDITSPEDGATLTAGVPFVLTADAFDVDGNLARVDFYRGNLRLGAATNAPYAFTWADPAPGSFALTAVARDTNGLSVTSPPVQVTIKLPTATLVARGAVWKYFDQTNDLGTAWRAPGFDDSGWPSGPAQLGFGDGDEATAIVSNRARLTTYFRRSFTVDKPSDFLSLALDLLRDDGAVVFLNGFEVFRSNMPTGTVAWATLAATTALIEDESTNFYRALLSPWTLRPGTNVLAVEVHQSSTASSDLSFDLALTAEPIAPQTLIPSGATWRYLDTGSAPAANWTSRFFIEESWPSGPAQLGFGDGDEATMVNTNRSGITTYFRHTLEVADPFLVTSLAARLLRDDGAVVYLNGVEVWRSNMPTNGAILAGTLAVTNVGGGDEATNFYSRTLDPTLLAAGPNTVAVELHQGSTNSSDLSFDFELSGAVWPGPALTLISPSAGSLLTTNAMSLVALANIPVSQVEFLANNTPIAVAPDTPYPFAALWTNPPLGPQLLVARARDQFGRVITSASVDVTLLPSASVALIGRGATWKYFDQTNNLGTAWRGTAFNDSAWPSGPGRLGFGGDGEVTTVASNRQWTTYFRRQFYVPNPDLIANLTARLTRDDGAVVYLNGAEIWRDTNMPAGVITNQTPALSALGGTNETNWLALNLQPSTLNLLQPGWNLLAAEVHQATLASSDLGFDCDLTGTALILEQPPLHLSASASSLALTWPAAAGSFALYSTTNLAPPFWTRATNEPVFSNDLWHVPLSLSNSAQRFFRLQTP